MEKIFPLNMTEQNKSLDEILNCEQICYILRDHFEDILLPSLRSLHFLDTVFWDQYIASVL